ncbi:MAG: periplasmic heavy metal sensor [Desulfuromonadaceae bacterium]|nr:periplasmic heavy metal sensor [Desulfuromonadaceae bacterium]
MQKILLNNVLIATALFFAVSLNGVPTSVAAEKNPQADTTQNSSTSNKVPRSDMMPDSASNTGDYIMMDHARYMGRGVDGYGRGVNPNPQGWQNMLPEQREHWRQMRSQFMQDTLPLRQELSAKQLEMEVLWDQEHPDPDKTRALSDRITELRSILDQKHDAHLIQCRLEFGDRGWVCPGGGQHGY